MIEDLKHPAIDAQALVKKFMKDLGLKTTVIIGEDDQGRLFQSRQGVNPYSALGLLDLAKFNLTLEVRPVALK